MIDEQKWYPVKPQFRCEIHGIVEPKQVEEGHLILALIRYSI